jgi:hypothetical protein
MPLARPLWLTESVMVTQCNQVKAFGEVTLGRVAEWIS